MRVSWRNNLLVFCLAMGAFLALAGCDRIKFWEKNDTGATKKSAAKNNAEEVLYTCPMHPEIVSPEPGSCPICNMDLEPKDEVLEKITADPNRVVISAQATVKPRQRSGADSVILQGVITYDERRTNTVAAYVAGRIEELFVRYEYTYIKKGRPILTLYSPDLVTAQEEYLFVLSAGDTGLAVQARKRLRLLGITEAQLNSLARTKKPQLKVTVYSPYEGYLKFSFAESAGSASTAASGVATSAAGMSGMGAGTSATTTPKMASAASGNNELREGQYVEKGQALFQVADLKKLWVVLTAPANMASGISVGQKVSITSPNNSLEKLTGTIDFIEPVVREGQQQTSMRVYVDNAGEKLRPNTLVRATVHLQQEAKSLMLPASAVWNIGRRSIVWVRGAPAGQNSFLFEAREVTTGATSGNFTEITGGLSGKELIAKEAGFMIDSESFAHTK